MNQPSLFIYTGCADYFLKVYIPVLRLALLLPADHYSRPERKLQISSTVINRSNFALDHSRSFNVCVSGKEKYQVSVLMYCRGTIYPALQYTVNSRSQLGGDCPVSLTQGELPLQFCLEGSNGACVALLLTEHCGGHCDSSHHSEKPPVPISCFSFISSFNTIMGERGDHYY